MRSSRYPGPGRPRTLGDRQTTLQIRLSEELRQALARLARAAQESDSAYVRGLIAQAVVDAAPGDRRK